MHDADEMGEQHRVDNQFFRFCKTDEVSVLQSGRLVFPLFRWNGALVHYRHVNAIHTMIFSPAFDTQVAYSGRCGPVIPLDVGH